MPGFVSREQDWATQLNRRHVHLRQAFGSGTFRTRSCVVTANAAGTITAKNKQSAASFTSQTAWNPSAPYTWTAKYTSK